MDEQRLKLIICDLYGTLIKADYPDFEVRNGFNTFWKYYKQTGCKFAISTDGTPQIVRDNLESTGLKNKFDFVFDKDHIDFIYGEPLKDLATICLVAGVNINNSIFIGDNYFDRDRRAAEVIGMTFVKVPQYRQTPPSQKDVRLYSDWIMYENPKRLFSFEHLIGKL